MKKNVLIGTGLATLALAAAVTPTLLKAAQPPKTALPITSAKGGTRTPNLRRCGTVTPSLAQRQKVEAQLQAFQNGLITSSASLRSVHLHPAGSVDVKVYWHVIKSSSGGGNLTAAQIQSQIDVLNKAYAGQDTERVTGQLPSGQPTGSMPYHFVLAGTDYTTNDNWYNAGDDDAMKNSLYKGTKKDLNVYTSNLTEATGGILGYATFPEDIARNGKLDGVVMDFGTLPNGTQAHYDRGDTLTHEAGHWFGLYHTFQDGCTSDPNSGDYVADTPAEGGPFFLVPPPYTDSCTGKRFPGRDPLENFMDYSDDIAMFQFTPGQATRSDLVCQLYRGY